MPAPLRPRATWRTPVAAVALTAVLAACAADDEPSAGPSTTVAEASSTTSTTSGSSSTTTSTVRPGRAFGTATTVQPLVTPSTTAPDDGTVPFDQLAVGDCADLPGLGLDESVEVTTAELVPCEEPHGVEIYRVISLNDDPAAPYPGDGAVLQTADQVCLDGFEAFVGVPYIESSLEIVHVRPDEGIWDDGDRRVHCGVHDRELAPLTGSVEGSGR